MVKRLPEVYFVESVAQQVAPKILDGEKDFFFGCFQHESDRHGAFEYQLKVFQRNHIVVVAISANDGIQNRYGELAGIGYQQVKAIYPNTQAERDMVPRLIVSNGGELRDERVGRVVVSSILASSEFSWGERVSDWGRT